MVVAVVLVTPVGTVGNLLNALESGWWEACGDDCGKRVVSPERLCERLWEIQ